APRGVPAVLRYPLRAVPNRDVQAVHDARDLWFAPAHRFGVAEMKGNVGRVPKGFARVNPLAGLLVVCADIPLPRRSNRNVLHVRVAPQLPVAVRARYRYLLDLRLVCAA